MRVPEAVWIEATKHLTKVAEDAGQPAGLGEPEDVRRVRRFRDLLSRLFRKSRTMRTVSVVSDLDPTGELAEHLPMLKERAGGTGVPTPPSP
jgi:hypothetical protein